MRFALAIFLACTLFASVVLAEEAGEVQGELTTVDGVRILRVWGTPYDMGYAQGRILGQEIHDLMSGYVLGFLPPAIFDIVTELLPKLFLAEPDYQAEIEGILNGMEDEGVSTYVAALGRHLTLWDFYAANSLADIRGMACSSISAWGNATQADPTLRGNLAMARNLDWTLAGEDKYLLSRSTLLMAYEPEGEDKQQVVSVTFPGFIGCLSCMNESGVIATQNMSHNSIGLNHLNLEEPFYPINHTLRQALSEKDVDGDNEATIMDVAAKIESRPRSGGFIVHVAQPNDGRYDSPAMVIETDNAGTELRYPAHMPEAGSDILLATNHFLLLRPPLPCRRLKEMRTTTVKKNQKYLLGEMWQLERNVMQDWMFSTTIQTMFFLPEEKTIALAWSDEGALSGDKKPVYLTWDQIFGEPEPEPEPPEDEVEEETAEDRVGGCG